MFGEYWGSMSKAEKVLYRSFAGASLGFVLLLAGAFPRPVLASANNSPAKREAATAQFARAEEMRAALNEKPADKRTLAEYKKVLATYDRVHLITPHAAEAPDSLVAMGELNTEMGDHFGRSYYQDAADAYQFLIREYPASKYAGESMMRLGQLQKDQLGDPAAATKTYQDYLKKFPHSPRKRDAQEALAELALMKNAETGTLDTKAARPAAPAKDLVAGKDDSDEPAARVSGTTSGGQKPRSGEIPHVQKIRSTVTPDGAEIIIELEDSVQFISGRMDDAYTHFSRIHREVSSNGRIIFTNE